MRFLLLYFFVDKLPRRVTRSPHGKLRILRQQMIHVSRDSAQRDVLHVTAIISTSSDSGSRSSCMPRSCVSCRPSFALLENRKVVHRHFRTKTGILLNECADIFDQRGRDTLKKLLIDKSRKVRGRTRFHQKGR